MLFGDNWPSLFATWASLRLESHESFVRTLGTALESEAKRIRREVPRELKKLEGEEREQRRQAYSLQLIDVKKHFPRRVYEMAFVSTFSFFEHELQQFCRKVQEVRGYRLSVRDLHGRDGIETYKTYLVKVAGIEFPADSSEWREIKHLQFIRNKIVHERGRFTRNREPEDAKIKEIRAFVLSKKGLVGPLGGVQLSEEFCLYAIDVFRRFIKQLGRVTPGM